LQPIVGISSAEEFIISLNLFELLDFYQFSSYNTRKLHRVEILNSNEVMKGLLALQSLIPFLFL